MRSVAVFLLLAFLTGFQAAVLSEEPPPSISEPNQTILEKVQGQIGGIFNQVAEKANNAFQVMREQVSEQLAAVVKGVPPLKGLYYKLASQVRDIHQFSQSAYNQGREAMNEQYSKAVAMMKTHPIVMGTSKEVIDLLIKKVNRTMAWLADHTVASLSNPGPKVQKKTSS